MMTSVQTGMLVPYLVEMFRFQAWIAMGKVIHPGTGKLERDLAVCRQMIDLLAELEARTEGNRSADETRLLQGALTELRLNYLDEMKKPAEDAEPRGDTGSAEKEPPVKEPTTREPTTKESTTMESAEQDS